MRPLHLHDLEVHGLLHVVVFFRVLHSAGVPFLTVSHALRLGHPKVGYLDRAVIDWSVYRLFKSHVARARDGVVPAVGGLILGLEQRFLHL